LILDSRQAVCSQLTNSVHSFTCQTFTLHPECRHASEWFMIACQHAFIGNTNCKPLVQFKETENKQDLLAREVVGTQISFCWANRWLEVPELTPITYRIFMQEFNIGRVVEVN